MIRKLADDTLRSNLTDRSSLTWARSNSSLYSFQLRPISLVTRIRYDGEAGNGDGSATLTATLTVAQVR